MGASLLDERAIGIAGQDARTRGTSVPMRVTG
jgi:hypothetical protein